MVTYNYKCWQQVQRSPDATQIELGRQHRIDKIRPDIAALCRWKHDTLEYTVCTLSELRQAASVDAGTADEMTRDVVYQQLDVLHSFVHAEVSDE